MRDFGGPEYGYFAASCLAPAPLFVWRAQSCIFQLPDSVATLCFNMFHESQGER